MTAAHVENLKYEKEAYFDLEPPYDFMSHTVSRIQINVFTISLPSIVCFNVCTLSNLIISIDLPMNK